MTFTNFKITQSDFDTKGIHPFEFERLGDFVVLAGPNGGGKSRILQAMEEASIRDDMEAATFVEARDRLRRLQLFGEVSEGLDESSDEIAGLKQTIARSEPRLTWGDSAKRPVVIRFVPGAMEVPSLRDTTDDGLDQAIERATRLGMTELGESALKYLYVHLKHGQMAELDKYQDVDEARQWLRRRDSLLEAIHAMVQVEVSIDFKNQLFLNGRPYTSAPLSKGQGILLQLAVALHARSATLSNAVLVLDEPETYLHPSALVDVIGRLEAALGGGQFWIATHSVPLIAYIASRRPDAFYLVKDGKIRYAERDPDMILNGLLGGEEGVGQLHHLTGLPGDLAMLNYATQCLFSPSVVGHRDGDPQEHQVLEVLTLDALHRHRVLDVGAGKGRLVHAIGQYQKGQAFPMLDYFALDLSVADRRSCIEAIGAYFPEPESRWFGCIDQITAQHGDARMDTVILCNVLHEVPPGQWMTLMGDMASVLQNEGTLLLVEDLEIKVGELPHAGGFIVLDTEDLELLFPDARRAGDEIRCCVHPTKPHLKAHRIPRSRLLSIDEASIRDAIVNVAAWSGQQIRALRQADNAGYRISLRHAFLQQQYVNARLYLDNTVRAEDMAGNPHACVQS